MNPPAEIINIDNIQGGNVRVHMVGVYLRIDWYASILTCEKSDDIDVEKEVDNTVQWELLFSDFCLRYRTVNFFNCENINVFVDAKLTCLSFISCKNLTVNMDQPVVGSLTFLRCRKVDLNSPYFLPIIRVEYCSNINFLTPETTFAVIGCMYIIWNKFHNNELESNEESSQEISCDTPSQEVSCDTSCTRKNISGNIFDYIFFNIKNDILNQLNIPIRYAEKRSKG